VGFLGWQGKVSAGRMLDSVREEEEGGMLMVRGRYWAELGEVCGRRISGDGKWR
jgi:hypothetical protein